MPRPLRGAPGEVVGWLIGLGWVWGGARGGGWRVRGLPTSETATKGRFGMCLFPTPELTPRRDGCGPVAGGSDLDQLGLVEHRLPDWGINFLNNHDLN